MLAPAARVPALPPAIATDACVAAWPMTSYVLTVPSNRHLMSGCDGVSRSPGSGRVHSGPAYVQWHDKGAACGHVLRGRTP